MRPSERFNSLIRYWAERVELPYELIVAQVAQESAFNPRAKSPAGANGLLQLMPGTAAEMNCTEPFNPDENLRAGTEYLARQLANVKLLLHGHTVEPDDYYRFALASYNCGYGYVRRAIKQLLERSQPITWATVLAELPKAEVKGRTADIKQVAGYVQKILPPP